MLFYFKFITESTDFSFFKKLKPCCTAYIMLKMKVLFVGDSMTGKTRALDKLTGTSKGAWAPYVSTISTDVRTVVNHRGVEISIWDCPSSLCKADFADADCCVVFGYNQHKYVQAVRAVSPDVLVHLFHNDWSLRSMLEAITLESKSPKGFATDEEVTIINVLSG